MSDSLAPQSLKISSEIASVLGELGFNQLTPIQAQAVPVLLAGKDLLGQSKTGSGKTLAFAIPILEKVRIERQQVQALVLCPTRELCTQVAREFRRFGRHLPGLRVLILCGGQPSRPQSIALAEGVHIIIGTPGRTLDHIERGRLNLSRVETLVLDEADQMLDMGFLEDMEVIINEVPRTRQTAFFSATFPEAFKKLSSAYQIDPVTIKIAETEDAKIQIEHCLAVADSPEKINTLLKSLRHFQPESALVFCNLKSSVADLTKALLQAGISSEGLHGDLDQEDRDRVMAKFRNQSTRILVATDVAARGLDVPHLQMVICFDLPHQLEDYVHRVGRTGRAGKSGIALTLVNPREMMRTYEFESQGSLKFNRVDAILDKVRLHGSIVESLHAEMVTFSISGGRKEKIRPADILGALTGEAGGLKGADVGKIEIHDHFTYVAIAKAVSVAALARLSQGQIKGRRLFVKLVQ